MYNLIRILLVCSLALPLGSGHAQNKTEGHYTYRSGDWNGIGKWYMGREIARVMGYQGMSWLERPEREKEERTSLLLKNMNIRPGDAIADIGAGSGYHVFKMADMAKDGVVYAVDIQDEMLAEIRRKIKDGEITNVQPVKGSEKSVNLPENSVDKVLIVDVYHEISFPKELSASLYKAMKADAKLYLIEYRAEDATVPIKKIHKMSEEQAVREMAAAGFRLEENIGNLPWQHCMVFVKE
ncbi:class I SAM-dependent methyltransferase [Lentiprolixibacter aurantiacus]|uniref:Class I SAM-dependent methyltransferase n=1 Tax=Lentiprolixibacter aurantiacus TaxID=2993939 RepID=A0AAE3MJ91_9FLAO|nr:class I SAM-dependent methyltransferase [Lentiprolixibacter aurantiacus]MCX2718132.1 class I SAM-dependent methyltransferase [Lentiprolixibacter aurantiacus]